MATATADEIVWATGTELAAMIADGRTTAVAALTTLLERVAKLNPAVNAVVLLDEKRAMARAARQPQRPLLGLYLFDYSRGRPIPPELHRHQLDVALTLLRAGRADGLIFLGSPVVDMPLEAVEVARQWIRAHSAEVL